MNIRQILDVSDNLQQQHKDALHLFLICEGFDRRAVVIDIANCPKCNGVCEVYYWVRPAVKLLVVHYKEVITYRSCTNTECDMAFHAREVSEAAMNASIVRLLPKVMR